MRLSVLVVTLLSSACAPRLFVNVLRPAPVNLGAAKKLSLVESQGRQSAREELLKELDAQIQGSGYFTLTDRTADRITVKISGQQVEPSAMPAADEVALRIDVAEWNADQESQPTRQKDKQGNVINKQVWKSRVAITVTAFNASGKTFLVEKEYRATAEDDRDEDAAILAAGRQVVAQLLEEMTPTYAQRAIQFDDAEEAQRPVIDLAVQRRDVPAAIEAEKALLAKNPNNAAGTFNLGVLLDSQGLYRDALVQYDAAIKLVNKELYREVRAECQQRLNDTEALAK
ncbi:MAG: hypothetical protein JNK82_05250 [Myxococcaceae bacterium]|nr:hypothetical protein [Myxococcaceae bacterium]